MRYLHLLQRSRGRRTASIWLTMFVASGWLVSGSTAANSGTGTVPGLARTEGRPIATIGVLPPDITLRELSAGGTAQERDDWSETARSIARDTLEALRPERFAYFADEEISDDLEAEIEDVQALYRTIDLAVTLYHMGAAVPPTAGGLSRQSLGSVDRLAAEVGADALLLVYGVDDIFTTDRKILAGLGVVAAAFTGVMVQPSSGSAHLSAALVSRDGRLLWFNRIGQGGISDLRTSNGVRRTLSRLLYTMPTPSPMVTTRSP